MLRSLATGLLLLCLLLPGCSGSDNAPVTTQPVESTGTLRLSNTLDRSIAAAITHLRVTGLDGNGQQVYGPQTLAKSTTMDFAAVPSTVKRIKVEYLRDGQVVGLGATPVDVVAGQITTVADLRYVDVTATVLSLIVKPLDTSVPVGALQSFTATAIMSDGYRQDVTQVADWSSTAPSVATVESGTGLASVVGTGLTQISASFQGVTNRTNLTGINANLQSVQLPTPPVVPQNGLQQATLLGVFDAGTFQVPGTFFSSDPSVFSVSSSGLLSGVAPGQGTLRAEYQGFSASAPVEVIFELVNLSLSLPNARIAPGGQIQFRAFGTFPNGSTTEVTTISVWSSSNSNVSMSDRSLGVAEVSLAAAPGSSATITASCGGQTATTSVNVGQRFVYVLNGASNQQQNPPPPSNSISQFLVGPNGQLQPLGNLPTPATPQQLFVHPTGFFAYLTTTDPTNALLVYSIGADGRLTLVQTLAYGTAPQSLVGDPTGMNLYLSTQDSLYTFEVSSNGQLSQVAANATPVTRSGAVDPTGRFFLELDYNDQVMFYGSIDLGGVINFFPQSPSTNGAPNQVVMGPGGAVYVGTDSGLRSFVLTESGDLLPQQSFTGAQPENALVLDPDDLFLYALGTGTIYVPSFTNPESLQLTAAGSLTGVPPLAIDPSGRFAYSANFDTGVVQVSTVNTNGTLSPIQTIDAQDFSVGVEVTP